MQGYLGHLWKQPAPLIVSQGMLTQQALLISVWAHLMKVKDCVLCTKVELCSRAGGVNSMRFSGSINKGKLRAITSGKAARRGRTVIARTLWAWSASGKKGHGKKKSRQGISFSHRNCSKRLILISGKKGNTLIKQHLEGEKPWGHSSGWGWSHSPTACLCFIVPANKTWNEVNKQVGSSQGWA